MNQLNNSNVEIKDIDYLFHQNINVFNSSDEFYTDICYHFESPNGKDVPLSDRLKSYYPNITLCDSGCTCIGVIKTKGPNETMIYESICQCTFNDIMNSEIIEGNKFLSNTIGELADILRRSNLIVLTCYEDIFKLEYFLKGTGGFVMLTILILELIFAFFFILYDMAAIRKYLYYLTEYFLRI